MSITATRKIEARRDSDDFLIATLRDANEEEQAEGYEVEITFLHDSGEEDVILLSSEEVNVLAEALDGWTDY